MEEAILGGVFLGVKNNSKNFGNKRLFSKILDLVLSKIFQFSCFFATLSASKKNAMASKLIFLINNVYLLKILLSNQIFFFVPIVFHPCKHLPKVKNSKMSLHCIFLGTPCSTGYRVSQKKCGLSSFLSF